MTVLSLIYTGLLALGIFTFDAWMHPDIINLSLTLPKGLGASETSIGDAVAEIVQGCTDAVTIPKPPWQKRKEDYIAHVHKASSSVRLVSASDKLHNARAILRDFRMHGEEVWSRFKGGKDGTLWYYRSLISAFRQAESCELIEELDRVVTEIERLVSKP